MAGNLNQIKATINATKGIDTMDAHYIAQTQDRYTKILREDLLDELRANLEKHEKEYTESLSGWRTRCGEKLRARAVILAKTAADLEAEKIEDLDNEIFDPFPQKPKSYVSQYRRIIRRMEMSQDNEIFLSHDDFDQYVLDDWSWKGEHRRSYAVNTAKLLHPGG